MSATDKWLQDMRTLKSNTDLLRTELNNGGVLAGATDTLGQLVAKVPNLAPIVQYDEWQPDPLWKFPDPNGSQTTKTIREIYDEDTITGYTYRGIFQIRGDLDTFDLKECMNARSSADTFILSDGTTYTNITATTLEHTWDTTKDVIDSKGIPMRDIRVYTNTGFYWNTCWYGQSVWNIWNLNTTPSYFGTSPTSKYYAISPFYADYLECVEFECSNFNPGNNNTGISAYTGSLGLFGKAQKVVIKNVTGTSSNAWENLYAKELDLYNVTSWNSLQGGVFLGLKKFTLRSTNLTTLTLSNTWYNYSGNSTNLLNIDTLDFSNAPNVTSFSAFGYATRVRRLILPPNTSTFAMSTKYIWGLEALEFPSTLSTLQTYNGLIHANTIKFNSMPTTITSGWGGIYCKNFIISPEWSQTLPSFTSCQLTRNGIVAMFENLADLTGQTAKTITLGAYHLSLLSAEDKAIATNKNWTLA